MKTITIVEKKMTCFFKYETLVCLIMSAICFVGDGRKIDQLSLGDESDETLDSCPLDDPVVEKMQESEVDSFEELFQRMCSMKSQADALDGAQRKAYAEKITMAFWQAIEGDEEEIEGLSSADEE